MEQLKKVVDGRVLFDKVSFTINKGDKIAFVSKDPLAVTYFFEIINGNVAADAGSFEWGSTITKAYLPLESIQSFNEQCIAYNGVVLLTSHDHTFMHTTANRIIELTPNGIIDRLMTFDEFLEDTRVKELQAELYTK